MYRVLLVVLGLCLFVAAGSWPDGRRVQLIPTAGFTDRGEYPSAGVDAIAGPRYASWSGSDGNRGTLHSVPFRSGYAISFALDGYPTHEGQSVYLERVRDHRHFDLRPRSSPGEAWTRQIVMLPPAWIGQIVELHAIDDSSEFRGWIGVGDVHNVSLFSTLQALMISRRFLAGFCLLLVSLLAIVPQTIDCRGASRNVRKQIVAAPALFLGAVLLCIVVCRMPSITYGRVLNPDEAQMTAQAITFAHHGIPWRDVDGTTSGPFNSLVVAVPALVGITPTLATSRFIGALLLFGTLWCLYGLIRLFAGPVAARVSVILPLSLFCGAINVDYLQYASELLPIFLTALASLMIALIPRQKGQRLWFTGAAGIAVGALPFAKLQATPLAALLAIVSCATVVALAPKRERIRNLATFIVATAGVPVLLLTPVAASGAFIDFLDPYVLFPKTYIAGNCCTYAGIGFFLAEAPFTAFLLTAIIFVPLFVGISLRLNARGSLQRLREIAIPMGLFAIMACVAIYAIEAPQTPFQHYTMLLVVPIVAIVGLAFGVCAEIYAGSHGPPGLMTVGVVIVAIAFTGPAFVGSLTNAAFAKDLDPLPLDPIAAQLRAIIRPNQRVAMWGWMPQYLVYTGALMGTRDSISQFQIENRPFRQYYRKRYLADFSRNTPDFVLEAVGSGAFAYHDRSAQGLSSFPDLWTAIVKKYTLTFDVDNVRLFERNDLIKQRAGAVPARFVGHKRELVRSRLSRVDAFDLEFDHPEMFRRHKRAAPRYGFSRTNQNSLDLTRVG